MENNIENKPMSLKERVDKLVEERDEKKTKKLRIPRKAKVRKGSIKKGWSGIVRIDENGNLTGEKQRLEDSTIRLKGKTYHSTDGSEVGFWEGKYPVMIQPTWRQNPIKIRQGDDENQTYGQKYIMARMLGDTIKVKTGGGKGLIWVIAIAAVAYLGYMLITGQF